MKKLSKAENKTFFYVLPEDRQLPADQQAKLEFRMPSAAEHYEIDSRFEETFKLTDDKRIIAECLAIIQTVLVGWAGVEESDGSPAAFEPSKVAQALDRADLMLIRANLSMEMTTAMFEAKKKLIDLPSDPEELEKLAIPDKAA